MLTPNERISRLEAEVVELRAMFRIAGALPVSLVQTVLDQMVDDGFLSAALRTEIWGRFRREVGAFRIGSAELHGGANAAIPNYATKAERAATHELHREFQKMEREILRPTPRKGGDGPKQG